MFAKLQFANLSDSFLGLPILSSFFDFYASSMQPQVAPGAIHIQPLRGCAF